MVPFAYSALSTGNADDALAKLNVADCGNAVKHKAASNTATSAETENRTAHLTITTYRRTRRSEHIRFAQQPPRKPEP